MSHPAPTSISTRPRFSALRVTFIVTLVWVGLFAYFVYKGAQGFQ